MENDQDYVKGCKIREVGGRISSCLEAEVLPLLIREIAVEIEIRDDRKIEKQRNRKVEKYRNR